MNKPILSLNNIDKQHIEKREIDGCKINLYFSEKSNELVRKMILDNLLDSFDRRIKVAQGC